MSQRDARDAQVRGQLASLHDAHRLPSELSSLLSHELRTPLSAILALSELLLGRTDGPLTEEQQRQVDYIHDAAEALLGLVDDLLHLTSIEAGNVQLEVETFTVPELFDDLRAMLPSDEGDSVPMLLDDPGGLPPLRSDRRKLARALRALVANAAQRSEQGQARVSAAPGERGQVVFCVSESGLGAPPPEAAAPGRRGSTLGVPLAFRLAALLGARLTFESEPGGGGSRFLFAIGPAGAGDRPSEPQEQPRVPQGQPRLLVIDDDEADRYLITRSLGKLGYEVRTAGSGAAGVEAACDDPPDVVIVDLRMPGVDGFDVLERLRSHPGTRHVPIVVHTGLVPESLEALLLNDRSIRFVDKSHVGSDRLAATVAELLSRRSP